MFSQALFHSSRDQPQGAKPLADSIPHCCNQVVSVFYQNISFTSRGEFPIEHGQGLDMGRMREHVVAPQGLEGVAWRQGV